MYKRAVQLASEMHAKQFRTTGVPYIVHPIAVSVAVRNMLGSEEKEFFGETLDTLMTAAVLHDVVEDCSVLVEELENWFSVGVAKLVGELTNDKDKIKELDDAISGGRGSTDGLGKLAYLKEKLVKMSNAALFIKLCDRLDNVSDSPSEAYIKATVALINYLIEHRPDIDSKTLSVAEKIIKVCVRYSTSLRNVELS